jgi:hypothetical protein
VVTPGSAGVSDSFDNFDLPYVTVYRNVIESGETGSLGLTATSDIAFYKSHYKAKVLTNKSITVAGWPARLLIFSGTIDGQKELLQHLIIAKDRVTYRLDMDGLLEKQTGDKALFKKMYLTFRPKP